MGNQAEWKGAPESRVAWELWIKRAAACIALVLLALVLHYGRRSGGMVLARDRTAMPRLVVSRLDGGTWRMQEHLGQVVLVNYWATWCGPCWEETPALIRVSQELGPKGLSVVGISVDEGGTAKVQEFVNRFKLPYPVGLSEPMSQMVYGMAGVPTTILVDRRGRVAKTYVGAMEENDLRRDIAVLLEEH